MSKIVLRKNPLSSVGIDIEYISGELLSDLLLRSLESNGYSPVDKKITDNFLVLVNGMLIETDMRDYVKVGEEDTILITPKVSRGEGGQLFKQIAIMVIAIVASVYISPMAGSGLYGALAATAVTLAGTLAMNALIPPPPIGGGSLGGVSSAEDSQMYSITGQSNAVNKYGLAPKVYGRHRIFPTIVGRPYTQIEVSPIDGELAQVFYAIYDFGHGPMVVSDLKIGDTPLINFKNMQYRWVDYNAPATPEGSWDTDLNTSLTLYSGDVHLEEVAVNIDSNMGGGKGFSEVSRLTSPNPEKVPQEIVLDFSCPQGLIAHGSDGSTSPRTILLQVQFRDTTAPGQQAYTWYNYNDLNVVDYGTSTGGAVTNKGMFALAEYLVPASSGEYNTQPVNNGSNNHWRAGSTNIIPVRTETPAAIGDKIFAKPSYALGSPTFWTTVTNITAHPMRSDWKYLHHNGGELQMIWGAPGLAYPASTAWTTQSYSSGAISFYPTNLFIESTVVGGAQITGETTVPYFANFKFKPKVSGVFEVRVRRMSSSSTKSYQILDRITLNTLTTRFFVTPIKTNYRHRFLELKIQATNQLSGNIQNLSGVVTSVLDVWNGTSWEKSPTRNPAWVVADLLTGPMNKKSIPKSRLHTDSLLEWSNFCSEVPPSSPNSDPRYNCDFILDFPTTIQSLINMITGASQASLNIIDGKYGVLVDKLKNTPVQVFTPRNYSDFSSKRNYNDPPHALKVTYIDRDDTWALQEVVVYADGYSEANAEEFEELTSFACTSWIQAWRFGRYMMAQAKLRKETINIKVDYEYLVCTRGDFVQITQDSMKIGGIPARVKSVQGTIVTLDAPIETSEGIAYSYVYRDSSGAITKGSVTPIDSLKFDVGANITPEEGDLIVIGETTTTVMDCIVKSIHPDDDLSAVLVLVEKADAVYDSEVYDPLNPPAIPNYSPDRNENRSSDSLSPRLVTGFLKDGESWTISSGKYKYQIDLSWNMPSSGPIHDLFEVYVNGSYFGNTKGLTFSYPVKDSEVGTSIAFKVLAVSANGNKKNLIDAPQVVVSHTKKSTPPSNVENLNITISGESATLDWDVVSDIDLKEYVIRYSPNLDSTWESSTLVSIVKSNTLKVPARTGTYLVKARDYNYNHSAISAKAITTIPDQLTINVVDYISDPTFSSGTLSNVVVNDGGLELDTYLVDGIKTYYSEGFFYYGNSIDLGEVYPMRVQSYLDAYGVTTQDIMSNWSQLSSVPTLESYIDSSKWNVETQVRVLNSDTGTWSSWTSFTVSDLVGRFFEFRVRLSSTDTTVSPHVISSSISADMPDRQESFNNLQSSISGTNVTYNNPFKGPNPSPNIQISQDNAVTGDYYNLEDKTLSGFKITFYDKDNNPVIRKFDVSVKGYGRGL